MTEDLTQIGRVAFRHEGDNWNAYYTLTDTMKDAIHLGSIRMAAVTNSPDVKQGFMNLMREVVSGIIAERTGHEPHWKEPQAAPDSERSGHA